MFCRKCGIQIPDDTIFCPQCGVQNRVIETTKDHKEISTPPAAQELPGKPAAKKTNRKIIIAFIAGGAAIVALITAGVIFAVTQYGHHTSAGNQEAPSAQENIVGNTPSNLFGFGLATIQGDTIYYAKTSAFSGKSILMSMDDDGTNEEKLYTFDGGITELNVIGNQLYFVGSPVDNEWSSDIYVLNLTDLKVKSVYSTSNQYINYLYVDKDKMYYMESDEENHSEVNMANLDGTEETRIITKENYIYNFVVIDNHLYYDYEDHLYQCDLDGKNEKPLYTSSNTLNTYCNGNSKIYIADGSDTGSPVIKSMDFDGSNILKLQEYGDGQWVSFINVTDNVIYYALETFNENADVIGLDICSMNIDGTDIKTIASPDCECYDYSVVGHWFFYYDYDKAKTVKIDLNESEQSE